MTTVLIAYQRMLYFSLLTLAAKVFSILGVFLVVHAPEDQKPLPFDCGVGECSSLLRNDFHWTTSSSAQAPFFENDYRSMEGRTSCGCHDVSCTRYGPLRFFYRATPRQRDRSRHLRRPVATGQSFSTLLQAGSILLFSESLHRTHQLLSLRITVRL